VLCIFIEVQRLYKSDICSAMCFMAVTLNNT